MPLDAQVSLGMKHPSLIIRRKGRPANEPCKEEARRAKAFYEELKATNASQLCLTEHTDGAAPFRNPGGKGTPKAAPICSRCQQAGHKAPVCPLLRRGDRQNPLGGGMTATSEGSTSATSATTAAAVVRQSCGRLHE